MNETNDNYKIINQSLIYSLNKDNKTASIIGYVKNISTDVIVPTSIIFESQKYIVTTIRRGSFDFAQILSLDFPNDSQIQTIERDSLTNSSIMSLTIPSSLTKLEDGWCYLTENLMMIKISPRNQNYIILDEKMIIGKTDPKSINYDDFIFACRFMKKVTLPSFIKRIGPHSLANTDIKYIIIPDQVTQICEGAFELCEKLESIIISPDSKLEKIEDYAFARTGIEDILIPSSVIELKHGWLSESSISFVFISPNSQYLMNLNDEMIVGKSDLKSDIYDEIIFVFKNLKNITIPQTIKQITPWSFYNSDVTSVFIPNSVTHIGYFAFFSCYKLERISFDPKSELQIIENNAFGSSDIKCFYVPPSVKSIGELAFDDTDIEIIEFDENCESISFDCKSFGYSTDARIMIPSKFKNSIFFKEDTIQIKFEDIHY